MEQPFSIYSLMPFLGTGLTAFDLPVKNICAHSRAYPLVSIFLSASSQYLPGSSIFLAITAERGGRAQPRPLSGVTRAPSAVQHVDHAASSQAQTTPSRLEENRQTFSLLGANAASIVKMNNLLNRNCWLTALSWFTLQLLNTLGGVPGCQPLHLLAEPTFPAPSLLSTGDIFDLFCQVRVKLQLFCDDFINSQLIDSKWKNAHRCLVAA